MYKRARCKGLLECLKSCPKDAILKGDQYVSINRELCNSCGACALVCPSDALILIGKETETDEIIREIEKDLTFYDESGGGVTFSGGEPTMQPAFLEALLDGCKERNIRTAVDTCGYTSARTMNRIKDKVDLFLYDIKSMDDKIHRKYTGVSNKLIIENFIRLTEGGNNISIRFAVIPGVNDNDANIEKTAELALSHGVKQICILPYHRAGIEKYRSMDRPYMLETIQSPSDEKMRKVKDRLIKLGLNVKIGGG